MEWTHLIHWAWLMLPLLGMAAATDALAAVDGAADAGGDTGGDGAESDAVATDESVSDGSAETEKTGEPGQTDQNLPLYKQAKAALEKIKAENPALAKQIQTALIRQDKADRALPLGFEKASKIITDLEQLAYPGSEGRAVEDVLTDIRSEVQGWREFDVKISNGDPSVIEELATAAPEALQGLIPAALAKFSELNPDGYSALVTQAVLSDANQAEIPLQLTMLRTFIPRITDSPEKNEIINAYNALSAWFERLKTLAAKPIAPKADPNARKGTENQESVQAARELDLTRREYNARSTGYGNKLLDSETMRILGAAKVTDEQKKQILSKVAEELDARLAANKDYGQAMRGYLANKNEEGYRRRLHSEYHKLIPGAVRRAIDDLGIKPAQKPAAKAGAAPAGKKPTAPTGRPQAAPEGFEKIAGHPRTLNGMPPIDLLATTQGMLMKHMAILRGGRKVRW